MKKFIELLSDKLKQAFVACGYDESYGRVGISNRPDLCEYQCNGAMAAAKAYKKAPFMIADEVVAKLEGDEAFLEVASVKPGFINLKVNEAYLASYLNEVAADEKLGCTNLGQNKKMIIDYGGPNVAKPLHVGHLRSAIIGESIKRISRYVGWDVVGDVHLGDWGLQMGLIIEEVRTRHPELCYFDDSFTGPYPEEAPFTISELEEIYPTASAKSKVDEEYAKRAHDVTAFLQQGKPGYRALWQHILNVSIADLKKNYSFLNVEFDLWKKESDAQPYIPDMIKSLKDQGLAYESEGALVVDVKEETDTKEVPPCIIVKSDGATLYSTTDLATLVEREKLFKPDSVLYVVDKRQEMHFNQVFRCAKKANIVRPETNLKFLGFGTMNGKDGKPFKTRDGGVMRLEVLLKEITEAVYQKTMDNRTVSEEEGMETAKMIALAAIKYGDLSNQASKDYVFDVERFTSFEGDTGPYILYTIVRIKSILSKCEAVSMNALNQASSESEKALQLILTRFAECIENAAVETAPHKICAYIYDVANAFNRFYHETKILAETDKEKQTGYLALLALTRKVLETSIDLLGFEAPERM
ncbi:Arginyl-tRNA synthetase [Lachnospiraceae bacterium TWA4]|nr:Arginyl-tRNA synthetase [Lachnospiraceae bacterium TWA4]